MTSKLLHPLSERRHARRHRRHRRHLGIRARRAAKRRRISCDPAVERVRAAGGPHDEACYTCQCGYLFNAAVSTTVACPNCGVEQAW